MDRVFQFPFVGGKKCIKADEIIYIETARHKNIFYVGDQTYSIYKKLDEIEEELKGMGFIRIHQSFLVNMYHVDSMSGSDLIVAGQRIPVSRRYYAEVKRRYQEILFEEVD